MRILIAEDEPRLLVQLHDAVQAAGYQPELADKGVDALHAGLHRAPNAAILDIGLPELDGLSILRQWREQGSHFPVLLLTARGSWQDKVLGMDAGADDYLAKPFHMEELLARLRALLRRSVGAADPILRFGPVSLDPKGCEVRIHDQKLELTGHEYRILSVFLHHPDQVLSRTFLSEQIYAQDQDRDSNTIDVFIARLRRKLPPDYILTQRGLGFRLNPDYRQ